MSEENKKDYQIDEVEQHIDDRDYMLQAIENDATWVLAYASEKLKEDKEFVLKAVATKWLIIKYVSYRLRSDKDVALCVLKASKKAKEYLTKEALQLPEVEEFLKEQEENK